jgi:hypothetical protein
MRRAYVVGATLASRDTRQRRSNSPAQARLPTQNNMREVGNLIDPQRFLRSRQVVADALDLVEVAGH